MQLIILVKLQKILVFGAGRASSSKLKCKLKKYDKMAPHFCMMLKRQVHIFPIGLYTYSKFILSLEWTVYTYSIRDLSGIKINSSQGDIGISNGCLIETRIILKRGLKKKSHKHLFSILVSFSNILIFVVLPNVSS